MPHMDRDIGNIDMTRRMIGAAGRRVAAYDEDQLPRLKALHEEVDDALRVAINQMRRRGVTWDRIGSALGVTRQAALMRWGGTDE